MSTYSRAMIELGYDGEYRPLVPEFRVNADVEKPHSVAEACTNSSAFNTSCVSGLSPCLCSLPYAHGGALTCVVSAECVW